MITERPLSAKNIFKSVSGVLKISREISRQFVVVNYNFAPKSNRLKFQLILRLINKVKCLGVRESTMVTR